MENVFTASSLVKVFPDDREIPRSTGFSMLKNEKKSFQIVFNAAKGEEISFKIDSQLNEYIKCFYVKNINGGFTRGANCDDYYLEEKGSYPDLLVPVFESFVAEENGFNSVWVHIAGESMPVGKYDLKISSSLGDAVFVIKIIDAELPKQELIYTNWFHTDCLMSLYGVEAFSEKYWQITERFLKRAGEYGMNCVLTPLFTPPLDTKIGGQRPTVQLVDVTVTGRNKYSFGFEKLDRWLEMCQRSGMEYYEMSHFFTQWGARHAPKIMAQKNGREKMIFGWKTFASGRKYKLFIQQFAKAVSSYIDKKGIGDRCFFHVSDEPAASMKYTYGKASKIVRKAFSKYKIIDALSSIKLYRDGLIKTPVPATDHIDDFIGNVPELWAYYCGAQGNKYMSNRFFAMPSERNRILGFQLYKFDVKGFLHWGYNFYYSQYSKEVIDPFKTADAGGKFPSGDSFVVYPGKDEYPMDSLRLHIFYDGVQDLLALKLLESKIGRENTLALLEEELENPLTFSEYPHDFRWLEKTRERINNAIILNS